MNRIIPIITKKDNIAIKPFKFNKANFVYLGDVINIVKIFSDLCADEIVVLDIFSNLDLSLIEKIAKNCFVPLTYGGGIRSFDDAKKIFERGVERVSINYLARYNFDEIRKISELYGKSSIVISFDIDNNLLVDNIDIFEWIDKYKNYASEFLISVTNKEGTFSGIEKDFFKKFDVNVIANCGVSSFEEAKMVLEKENISIGVGSVAFFKNKNKNSILINYKEAKNDL